MKNRLISIMTILIGASMLLSGCYEAQRFAMPDKVGDGVDNVIKVPDPFDGSNEISLVKNGVPDFSKISVMGFTDFAVDMPYEESSWIEGVNYYGDRFFGCRPHRNFYADGLEDHFGGDQLSYVYNALTTRVLLENGTGKQWKITARISLGGLSQNTHNTLSFEAALGWEKRTRIIFDTPTSWGKSQMNMVRNATRQSPVIEAGSEMYSHISPEFPFEIEICCVDDYYYVRINGVVNWAYSIHDGSSHASPLVMRPWQGDINIYDLTIEGDYIYNEPVGVQKEANYATIQAPALAAIDDDEVLLFAEGRSENIIQSSLLASVRSNATDIIMKRSSDGGKTWGSWSIIKGGDQGVYQRPEVINAGDKLYLFYTVDITGKQDGNYRTEYMVSADGGVNWVSGNTIHIDIPDYEVSTLSGHGIKTSTGRLMLPLQCRYGRLGTVAILYSDDDGTSWAMGDMVEGLRNNSASLIETENGHVVMYLGHSTGSESRLVVTSSDSGETWSTVTAATIPTGETGGQGYGATVKDADGKIRHFSPTYVVSSSSLYGSSVSMSDPVVGTAARKEIYIYKPPFTNLYCGLTTTTSIDEGLTWTDAEDISGFTSYEDYIFAVGAMDAVVVGNEVVLVVESGSKVPYEGLLIFRR